MLETPPTVVRNAGIPLDLDWIASIRANRPAIERRATRLGTLHPIDDATRAASLLHAVSCTDLTSLAGDDTEGSIGRLCARALQPLPADLLDQELRVAAVCVYHAYVATAVKLLHGSGIPVAAVSAGFPTGLTPLALRQAEIRASLDDGAAEIDIVITRAHVLTGDWTALYHEVRALREACGDAVMKAIIATGELGTLQNVARASTICMMAGADFIKTSTGKEKVNATLPAGVAMARAIRQYHERTGYTVGLKPAGGIRTAAQALDWVQLITAELGHDWLRPSLFRIGASSLLDDIQEELTRSTPRARGRRRPREGAHDDVAFIVSADADLESAVDAVADTRQGANPTQGPPILVQEGVDTEIATATFRTAAEAIELLGGSSAEIPVSIWTESLDLALDLALRLPTPTVYLNGTAPAETTTTAVTTDTAAPTGTTAATHWSHAAPRFRASALHALAQELESNRAGFALQLARLTGLTPEQAGQEIHLSLERLSSWAGQAARLRGQANHTPGGEIELTFAEPIGTLAVIVPDRYPILGLISASAPALAVGNRIIALMNERAAAIVDTFTAATEAAGIPAEVLRLSTGPRLETGARLIQDASVDAIWFLDDDFGDLDDRGDRSDFRGRNDLDDCSDLDDNATTTITQLAARHQKPLWILPEPLRDWTDPSRASAAEFLQRATKTKKIWIPYGR